MKTSVDFSTYVDKFYLLSSKIFTRSRVIYKILPFIIRAGICIDVDVVVYVVLRRYFVKSMENQQKSMTTSFIVDIIHCQAKQHERKLNRKGLLLYYVTIQDFKSQCVKFSKDYILGIQLDPSLTDPL